MLLAWLLLAFAAVACSDYRFGVNDQAQYLVHLIQLERPGVFVDDPYLASFAALRSGFWRPIAWFTDEATRPEAFLLITGCITLCNVVLVTLVSAGLREPNSKLRLSTLRLVDLAPASVLVTPKEQNWFGLVGLSDVELTATFAVTPLVFVVILAAVRAQLVIAWSAALLACVLHAQTGAFLLASLWAWTLLSRPRTPLAIAGLSVSAALGVAALLWLRSVWALPSDLVEDYQRIGTALFAELLDPLSAPVRSWGGVILVVLLGVGVGIVRRWTGERETNATDRPVIRLEQWGVASAALPVMVLPLHALSLNEPVLWKLMTGRAMMLPMIAALVLFAWFCGRLLDRGGLRAGFAWLALAAVAVWSFPGMSIGSAVVGVVLVAGGVLAASRPRQASEVEFRRPGGWAHFSVIVLCLGLGLLGLTRFQSRPFPWLRSAADTAWIEAQQWARANTPPDALFVTPPDLSGWRTESHRSTVGELLDGGLLFFAGEPLLAWERRMQLLGIEEPAWRTFTAAERAEQHAAYRAAITERRTLERLGDEYGRTPEFVVARTPWPFSRPPIWNNERFAVWALPIYPGPRETAAGASPALGIFHEEQP
ncbi:MAG: DUF6798 domain-containing protein [Planctomycetota bacterium]